MKKQRTILITNDDGIEAPGILLLAELAREFGEAVVVAPSSQCSAMSQRLTLKQEMEIRAREEFPVEGVKAWSLDGTPADCVKIALRILSVKPDLVSPGSTKASTQVSTSPTRVPAAPALRHFSTGSRRLPFPTKTAGTIPPSGHTWPN